MESATPLHFFSRRADKEESEKDGRLRQERRKEGMMQRNEWTAQKDEKDH